MASSKIRYVCTSCGRSVLKWMGRCPSCGEWNTLQEELVLPVPKGKPRRGTTPPANRATPLTAIACEEEPRLPSGLEEFDRVLGGGVVKGSVVLVGGEPGIGKSTLLTQVADRLARVGKVLYLSGEESPRQIRLRAERLGATSEQLLIASETELDAVLALLEVEQPLVAVVDSIQTLYTAAVESAPSTVSQVRACAASLQRLAKEQEITLFLIGHVTKEGAIAGPKVLEHLVDTVLYFEGEAQGAFRVLRAVKNRFGTTDEIGVFEMQEVGLVPVPNPSELLLAERASDAPGSTVFPAMEGSRALLAEVQALTTPSFLNTPRRVITGLNYDRVSLVLAVMEKRLSFRLATHDTFVNVAGGLRITEPAADLAVLLAVASTMRDRPVAPDLVVLGEVGLGGEVRAVPRVESRLREAARLGFQRALLPRGNLERLPTQLPIRTLPVRGVQEAVEKGLLPPGS